MNRKKYKVSSKDYKDFENQYLMDILRDADNYIHFGQAFLTRFPDVLQSYIELGGDLGIAEAKRLWEEPDKERAKKIIALWIE